MKIIALDFDGVISDSINECLLVGYNAYVDYKGESGFLTSINLIDRDQYHLMILYRRFVFSAEDYIFINYAIDNKYELKSHENFQRFVNKYRSLSKTFYALFYFHREELFNSNKKIWLKLNPLYNGIYNYLKNRKNEKNLYIISTKKEKYIFEILKGYDLEFNPKRIICATKNNNKKKIINKLIIKYKIEAKQVFFIDDQIHTLIETKRIGTNSYLAAWGYNTNEDKNIAKINQIPALTINRFINNGIF